MANYKRRFTKEEFQKELFTHLRDMPKGHFQNPKKLQENAAMKAEHYSRALAALDAASERLRRIAESHPDPVAKQDAETAISDINEAINAYGEASMAGNSGWSSEWNSER